MITMVFPSPWSIKDGLLTSIAYTVGVVIPNRWISGMMLLFLWTITWIIDGAVWVPNTYPVTSSAYAYATSDGSQIASLKIGYLWLRVAFAWITGWWFTRITQRAKTTPREYFKGAMDSLGSRILNVGYGMIHQYIILVFYLAVPIVTNTALIPLVYPYTATPAWYLFFCILITTIPVLAAWGVNLVILWLARIETRFAFDAVVSTTISALGLFFTLGWYQIEYGVGAGMSNALFGSWWYLVVTVSWLVYSLLMFGAGVGILFLRKWYEMASPEFSELWTIGSAWKIIYYIIFPPALKEIDEESTVSSVRINKKIVIVQEEYED